MQNRWSESDAADFVGRYAETRGEALALRTYSSRLIGTEPALVLHGGGNTSLKAPHSDVLQRRVDALFIKASGHDLASIEPEGHVPVALDLLRGIRDLPDLDDFALVTLLRAQLFDPRDPTPSIETPVHACVPGRYVDHTHADAILALTNQPDGEHRIAEALGEDVVLLPYVAAGMKLARQVAVACEKHPEARAMVWMRHGILTWGESARESYERMIRLVSRAESYLAEQSHTALSGPARTPIPTAEGRAAEFAPVLRGLLAERFDVPEPGVRRVVLRALVNGEILEFVDSEQGRALALSPPLTADHLIRTKVLPLWLDAPQWGDAARFRGQLETALRKYAESYRAYLQRNQARMPPHVSPFDPLPRVLFFPGLGALCAGPDARAACIARDITAQTVAAKTRIAAMQGTYQGLDEEDLFDMEYRPLQTAKLSRSGRSPLTGCTALVTGAAGAIGSGISVRLLEAGAHVAVTDLPGDALDGLVDDLQPRFDDRVLGVPLDVSDPGSVAAGFATVSRAWGGVDHVVINAGLAHVAGLDEMDLERFRLLERVNIDGTLLLLGEAGRHMTRQGTGGDIVLVSTKNVFAPGARFGAYSATKAAAHQLARIASLELAERDIRVNMVAPDAVFSHGDRRSGLWAEVGPDRMKARGLDSAGLEDYYRSRNLLKVRITADHVANAVLFFLTRQTPTTGATLPVDGGLPDATPR